MEVAALKADADLALSTMIVSSLVEALILVLDSAVATTWDTLSSRDAVGIAREETHRCCRWYIVGWALVGSAASTL